jgi:diguanylate cyclase (GGDEF)-like protein
VLALRAAQRRVRALSNIDALTGLANRGVFERVLEREWARARREQRPVSLLVCDVDSFRQYDAHYGALAADRCLERVASIVAARSRRAGDLVARHGRDRFALLLPGASEFAALDIADSIRSDVFGLTLLHGASDAERVVTVSCGVATLTPGSTDAAGTLMEAAMHALRCAKRAGRNCVRMAGAAPAMDGR